MWDGLRTKRAGSVEWRIPAPVVWVLASRYYAPDSELFVRLDGDAVRRSFANVRNGSVLVRYEVAPGR
jgi:hypothetical protein